MRIPQFAFGNANWLMRIKNGVFTLAMKAISMRIQCALTQFTSILMRIKRRHGTHGVKIQRV